MAQQFQQRRLQWWIAIRGAKRQNFRGLAAQYRVDANLQLISGEKLRRGTCHHKRQRALRYAGRQPAKYFFSPLIGKQQFPTDGSVAVQYWRRRRRDFQAVAVAL